MESRLLPVERPFHHIETPHRQDMREEMPVAELLRIVNNSAEHVECRRVALAALSQPEPIQQMHQEFFMGLWGSLELLLRLSALQGLAVKEPQEAS